MPTVRNTFHRGIMDKDTDERLISEGVLRHAENVNIITSEGSDTGSVENILSNKRLTNLFFGSDIETIGKYVDKAKNKLYWFVISNEGCYLAEYDQNSGSAVMVLADTRDEGERVLDLSRKHSITGVAKIVSEEDGKDLLLWTDNNMDICCINIERAKTYGVNGFEKEDIVLIKKYPISAPVTKFIYSGDLANNIEERFFSFAYRYKYLDGEYSALSPFSNYKFNPKQFRLDYDTLENLAMVNSYNAVRIEFDTGDKRVTDIQIIAKSSNSNNLYVIETFNKKDEDWTIEHETKSFTYKNNKLYTLLPEKELYRAFDNVPRKALALSLIGNRPIFGNYLEGYDIIDKDQNRFKIDFEVFINNYILDKGEELEYSFTGNNHLQLPIVQTQELKEGFKLSFYFYITENLTGGVAFDNDFEYILNKDYENLLELWNDIDFQNFFQTVNGVFQQEYNINTSGEDYSGWVEEEKGEIYLTTYPSAVGIGINGAKFKDTYNDDEIHTVGFTFQDATDISISEIALATSLHSNRDYEAVIIYLDEFGRQTIGLPSKNNTVYIPQSASATQNKLGLRINNPAPYWAKAYKIGVKSQPLTYQTVYVTRYYNEGAFVWCKLEGDNKDKVKEGDVLILKTTPDYAVEEVIKTKVLEIKSNEKDFITGNVDSEGNEIEEEAGLYMKIKPVGFTMSFDDNKIYQNSSNAKKGGSGNYPQTVLDLFTTYSEDDPDTPIDIPIPAGSSIYLFMESANKPDAGWQRNTYEETHYANRDYDDLEDWFTENILNRDLYGNKGNNTSNYKDNIEVVRGVLTGSGSMFGVNLDVIPNDNGKLYFKVKGTRAGMSKGRSGYLDLKIIIHTSEGIFTFETEPSKETDLNIFYQSEETFWIDNDGNHKAVTTNRDISEVSANDQDVSIMKPAEIELSFHNCYAFGNGVESYKIKDAFNSNFLNVDLRPTTTSVEEYKEVRRYADLTYSEPFVESSNINGINEFNASTANWKELDKQDGAIFIIYAREGDLLVIQKNKWGRVLYGKDALFNTDGTTNVSKVPYVLGQHIPYAGEYGMTDPESFAVQGSRVYGVDKERGVVLRLSNNGLTPITYGMKDWFRDIFHKNNRAKAVGGIDPYNDLYQLTVGDQPERTLELQCDNIISKFNQEEPFTYFLRLNNLNGEVLLPYNITQGNATITAEFDGQTYVESNVTNGGNLSFERTSLIESLVKVTITPIGGAISYTIGNVCPMGTELKIVTIILNDEDDLGQTMTNRFRWGNSGFYEYNDLFEEIPCSRFQVETGIEGQGKFPLQGALVNMQTIKDSESTGSFNISDCNKLLYLITDTEYTESDITTILDNANQLPLSTIGGENQQGEINQGSFVFNRANQNQILYMIWDYTNRSPVVNDDYANVQVGQSVTINVLSNDEVEAGATVSVITLPQFGSYVVNPNQTITYTHNGSANFDDSFEYQVNQDGCLASATVHLTIGLACGDNISANGGQGLYEVDVNFGTAIGECGIDWNVFSIPDRFQIYYDDVLVADSLFQGNLTGQPITPGTYNMNVFNYNPTTNTWFDTDEDREVTITSEDIGDTSGITNGTITFQKTTAFPTTAKIVVIGHPNQGGTAWNIPNVICPED